MWLRKNILTLVWLALCTLGSFCFLPRGLHLSEAKPTVPSIEQFLDSFQDFEDLDPRTIDLTDYELNEGKDYELSLREAQESLPFNELVIWRDDFKDSSRSGFISITKMEDFEGNPVSLEESLQIFAVDLDGDLSEEILLVPRLILGNNYRATILKKFLDYYQPVAISEITGDYYYVVDIRDLNQDDRLDLILGCSSGASSYQDIREIFWTSEGELQTQIFNQWVRLRDFNRDGIFELLVDYAGGTSGPHSQWAYWTDIYVWDGHRYEKDNVRYAEYYEEELIPSYISEILSSSEDSQDSTVIDRMFLIEQAQAIVQEGMSSRTSDPAKAKPLYQRGKEFLNQNKLEEALSELIQAFYLEPYNLEIVQSLVEVYLAKGDYERAISYSFKAIQLAPEQAAVWESLGYSYLRQGQYDKAISCLSNYLRYASDIHRAVQALLDLSNKEADEKIKSAIQKTLTNWKTSSKLSLSF